MELLEAIQNRHSVRKYLDKKIDETTRKELTSFMEECNRESGMNIQINYDEPTAFQSMLAKYGKFENVNNYIALVGKDNDELEQLAGYYGEKIVIKAQQLGLNTCWVAISFNKRKTKKVININSGEKLLMIISLGYGENQGFSHKEKEIKDFYTASSDVPQWFLDGIKAASLAPTARNQQKFKFHYDNGIVELTSGSGIYSKTDMGIVKYHFEVGAKDAQYTWK